MIVILILLINVPDMFGDYPLFFMDYIIVVLHRNYKDTNSDYIEIDNTLDFPISIPGDAKNLRLLDDKLYFDYSNKTISSGINETDFTKFNQEVNSKGKFMLVIPHDLTLGIYRMPILFNRSIEFKTLK